MDPHHQQNIIHICRQLIDGYQHGRLGECRMPEDAGPAFSDQQVEERLVFFTLPMSLNYQRNSDQLWEAARKTWDDQETSSVFSIHTSATCSETHLRHQLQKYKLALQPNKHIATWRTIAQTIDQEWGTLRQFLQAANYDILSMQTLIQQRYKKGFPYLSGPKIFHYWCFIMSTYGHAPLTHRDAIEIAPDTHIIKCSVKLGVITQQEATSLKREDISARWRELLKGSSLTPIDLHPPLWFWSRSGFRYQPAPLS